MTRVCMLGRRWEGKSKVVCGDLRHSNNTPFAVHYEKIPNHFREPIVRRYIH